MLMELLEQIILVGKICWYSLDDSWINLGHALRYWRRLKTKFLIKSLDHNSFVVVIYEQVNHRMVLGHLSLLEIGLVLTQLINHGP